MKNVNNYKNINSYPLTSYAKYRIVKEILENEKLECKLLTLKTYDSHLEHNCKLSELLRCLSENNQFIIEHEFIKTNTYQVDWYLEFFSKATYYKLRKIAIDEFLFYYSSNNND